MPSLGPMEILVILVVALVVLGPTKLPEAGRQVGKALAEFRRWSTGMQRELRDALDVELDGRNGEHAHAWPAPASASASAADPGTAHGDPGPAAQKPPADLRPPSDFPEQQSFS